ncbi:MAG: V-type ATP synthase subunit F [Caldisericota bacterium]|nr:V-type ATP synthase subunit F [Caldisericota bacterium]
MHKLAFVGEERIGALFRSFGFDVFVVKDSNEAAKQIADIVKKKKFNIVVTTEDFVDRLKEFVEERRKGLPIVFVLPSPVEYKGTGIEWVRYSVEKAIGIDIFSKKNE